MDWFIKTGFLDATAKLGYSKINLIMKVKYSLSKMQRKCYTNDGVRGVITLYKKLIPIPDQ